jgi:hypothetical protein
VVGTATGGAVIFSFTKRSLLYFISVSPYKYNEERLYK